MIQLSTLMWATGIFFAIIGFLRGWNKELVSLVGIVLMVFALFQFDSLLRGTVFLALPPAQVFVVQAVIFLGGVIFLYQGAAIGAEADRRAEDDWQAGFLGAAVGFINGYLITGTIWYMLDINEYPFEELVIAP
ncbi:MAG: CvpA family protein, partial [Anaerolineae bacterium]|nr:CvpA family protein [Anaerolineae bacterium]